MKREGRRRFSFFIYLLASYIFIALVPVIALLTIIYSVDVNNIRREIDDTNNAHLQAVSDVFEQRLQECRNIAAMMSTNTVLSYRNLSNDGSINISCREELQKYNVGNSFIKDIYIGFTKDDLYYSMRGRTNLQSLMNNYYILSSQEQDDLRTMLSQEVVPRLNYFADSDILIYSIPPPPTYALAGGVILFTFNGAKLRDLMSIEKDGEQVMMIIDSNYHPIFYNNSLGQDKAFVQAVQQAMEQNKPTFPFRDTSYQVYSRASTSGYRFMHITNASDLQNRLIQRSILIIAIVCGALAVLLTLAIKTALTLAKPVRNLNQLVSELTPEKQSSAANEFANIASAVSSAFSLNKDLQRRLFDQVQHSQHSYITMLVNGVWDDRDTAMRQMAAASIEPAAVYGVICIRLPGEIIRLQQDDLIQAVRPDELGCRLYAAESDLSGQLMLLAFLNGDGQKVMAALASRIAEYIKGLSHETSAIGVSQMTADILQVPRLRTQASCSVAYHVNGPDPVTYFDDLVNYPDSQKAWITDELYLIHAMRQGQSDQANTSLEAIFNQLQTSSPSRYMLRYHCYHLLDGIIKTASDIGAFPKDSLADDDTLEQIMRPLDALMISSFKQRLAALVGKVCAMVQNDLANQENQLKEHVLNYLTANYANPGISLDHLTDQFGYSIYYWSRFFKEKIGLNFSEYLWKLRLDKAKMLLSENNLSVAEVAQAVGYYDVNSFTRKFRTGEGIAPGQYRKIYGSGRDDSLAQPLG